MAQKTLLIHNTTRAPHTKQLRMTKAGSMNSKKNLFIGGAVRVIRGRPASVGENFVKANIAQLVDLESRGLVEVTDDRRRKLRCSVIAEQTRQEAGTHVQKEPEKAPAEAPEPPKEPEADKAQAEAQDPPPPVADPEPDPEQPLPAPPPEPTNVEPPPAVELEEEPPTNPDTVEGRSSSRKGRRRKSS